MMKREVISCGAALGLPSISKIIFDQSTNNLYVRNSRYFGYILTIHSHLSGFRGGWPILDDLEWSETCYVEFGLAKPSEDIDWYDLPQKWEL